MSKHNKIYKWRTKDNQEYDIDAYSFLLRDQRRNTFYKDLILKSKITSVIDFGCGIPILSKICLDTGVSKVYAIDKNPNLIPILEEMKIQYADRFEYFITDDTNLPDIKVDCIISEMYGSNLYHENLYHIFKNLKKLLTANGDFLPQNFKLSCALTNFDFIDDQTKKVAGTIDNFDWLLAWDSGIKTKSHIKYWLPLDTNILSYQSTKWFSFKNDLDQQSFTFSFTPNNDLKVDLLNIVYEIGENDCNLPLAKNSWSDSWGNQFIRLPQRNINAGQTVGVELYVLDDFIHIGARWI